MSPKIERTLIGNSLEIPRVVNGLWQLAGGHDENVDIPTASTAMEPLIDAGLDCFDMADHYGDAELVVGHHNKVSGRKMIAFTKWFPEEKGVSTFQTAEAAVDLALKRMGLEKSDLLQYHVWDYSNPTYLHNMAHLKKMQELGKLGLIGLTNVDAAHLELLINTGFPIATNQISCSVIDRRLPNGRLSDVCSKHEVSILAYGTLLGGFLSEKWLGEPEPTDEKALNWSLRKYLRFIRASGGWQGFQKVLRALETVAHLHKVSIAAVATRWVLEIPVVKAVILGTRLSAQSSTYVVDIASIFSFQLSEADHNLISEAQKGLRDIPGDCGDEYRRPPFLTVTGDLSQHLSNATASKELAAALASGRRVEYCVGTAPERLTGSCRAIRTGNAIHISGITACFPIGEISVLGGRSAKSQAVATVDLIQAALKALGSSLPDVVKTRCLLRHAKDYEEVAAVHSWAFSCVGIRPANLSVVGGLTSPESLVEMEAEAVVGSGAKETLKVFIAS